LILISPIKSVNSIARNICGTIADYILEERFDNMERAKNIRCPTFVLHGLNDKMVPFTDSVDLIMYGFIKAKAHLFLREDMRHNKFEYEYDLIKPLKYFFMCHDIKLKNDY
jgi:hypothetical protein